MVEPLQQVVAEDRRLVRLLRENVREHATSPSGIDGKEEKASASAIEGEVTRGCAAETDATDIVRSKAIGDDRKNVALVICPPAVPPSIG